MQRRSVAPSAAEQPQPPTKYPPQQQNQKRRKKTISKNRHHHPSIVHDIRRMIQEDGPFLVMMACLACVLLVLIVIVGYKMLLVLVNHRSQRHHNGMVGGEVTPLVPLPFHPFYKIPEAMETMGDRSAAYAKLRKEYDTDTLPKDLERSLQFVHNLNRGFAPKPHAIAVETHHSDQIEGDDGDTTRENGTNNNKPSYDIYNCPHTPPRNYPYQWKLHDQLLKDWPADSTDIPNQIYQGLCVFDYTKDYDKALNYRQFELPFVVANDPEVARTVERWHQPGYVEQMVGPTVKHRVEYNTNNHFLYHMPPGGGKTRGISNKLKEKLRNLKDAQGRPAKLQNNAVVPENMRLTYGEWLQHANVTKNLGPNDEHWYFRLIGCGAMGNDGSCDKGSTEALFDELPFFQPNVDGHHEPLYLGDPKEQKGIHCRFGMKGVIAENHFDGSRNAIALLYGARRYILAHPGQCDKLALLPKQHPSARHSAVDYTNPDLELYPEFQQAMSNEVVLQPGQVLYLPTNWFHFIVSLELNYQCNTRSGITEEYMEPIHDCGF